MSDDDRMRQYAEALQSARSQKSAQETPATPEATARDSVPAAAQPLPPRQLEAGPRHLAVERRLAYFTRQRYRLVAVGAFVLYGLVFSIATVKATWVEGWALGMIVVGIGVLAFHRTVLSGTARADAEAAVTRDQEQYNSRRAGLPAMLLRAAQQHENGDLMSCFDTMMEVNRQAARHREFLEEYHGDDVPPDDKALMSGATALYRVLTKHGQKPPDRLGG